MQKTQILPNPYEEFKEYLNSRFENVNLKVKNVDQRLMKFENRIDNQLFINVDQKI